MKELLEAGVHFGHQVRRWNPKMKEYIFGERNGIYIIDLQKTQRLFKEAVKFVTQQALDGRAFLFVGTKRQAQDAVEEEAKRCGQYFVNHRWLGGLLTNFQTVQKSIQRLKDIEAMRTDGRFEQLTKKERLGLEREHSALEKNLAGIRDMGRLPDVIFIIDSNKEEIAVHEANKLGIPVVAIVDTNCSPEGIDYIVPGNDDALRAVRLFAQKIADAGRTDEGRGERPQRAQGRPRDRRGKRRTTYVPPGAPPLPEPGSAAVSGVAPIETHAADQPGAAQEAAGSRSGMVSRNGEAPAEHLPGSENADDAFKKAEAVE